MTTVDINEVFGPTIQGEGPLTGRRAMFVRLARCDLSCSWCDTPYTWDWGRFDPATEIHEWDTATVIEWLDRDDPDRSCGVVITGGEPLLQRRAVTDLAARIAPTRPWVQIETNGRHAPPAGLHPETVIVASPKLANSGIPADKRIVPEAITALREWPAAFKFVVTTLDDLDAVDGIVEQFGLGDVWVMPEGTTAGRVAAIDAMADDIIARGYNLSTRLHVTLWGARRGV